MVGRRNGWERTRREKWGEMKVSDGFQVSGMEGGVGTLEETETVPCRKGRGA